MGELSGQGYYDLMKALAVWAEAHCQGRMVIVLEGGYNLKAGQVCSQGAAAGMLGEAWADPLGPAPQKEGEDWKSVLDELKTRRV